MRRKKTIPDTVWLTWEGDDFPRSIHSDSVVFYTDTHIYLENDDSAKRSLARAIQLEGIAYSLGESFRVIDQGTVTHAGYVLSEEDPNLQNYCDNDDPALDWDATFVEVAYVD